MGRLEGKVAIVTGAARGIGAAIASAFVDHGAAVVLTDIRDEEGRAMAEDLGSAASYERLDVRLEEDWERVVRVATERHGNLNVLVNNAAILHLAPLLLFDLTAYRELVETNQIGCFLGMRTVIGPMREAGGGSIVNIASVDATQGTPGTSGYAATKWALRGMTKVAAVELGPLSIRVNVIHPGGIVTPMTGPEMSEPQKLIGIEFRPPEGIVADWPLRRMGDPAEIAQLAVFLASDESSFVTGAEMTVDGGATAGNAYADIKY